MSEGPGSELPKLYIANIIDTPVLGQLRIRLNHAMAVLASGEIGFIHALDAVDAGVDILGDAQKGELREQLSSIAVAKGFALQNTQIIDLRSTASRSRFLFPGFIDTHTHAPQYPNTGLFGRSTLLDWLETYTFPMESSFSDIERAKLVYPRVVDRMLSNGTTCAAYHATIHVEATNYLVDVCKARGQRALVGRVCMDRMAPEHYRDESTEAAVRKSKSCIEHARKVDPEGALVRPVVTPRFAPSCKEETLLAMGELAGREQTWIQTHMSENPKEIELVHELFPHAKDYASVYDENKLLTDKTILAHVIHFSEDELQLLRRRGAKVNHCPASNTCLASGVCPVRRLLKAGVEVSLGTDMSGGYSPSILEMARQAMSVSRHIAMSGEEEAKLSVEEALYLATMGGAKSVGLEEVVGTFDESKHFDAVCVGLDNVTLDTTSHDVANGPLGPADIFAWQNWNEKITKWLYCGDDRNVERVWVKGKQVKAVK